MYYNSKAVYCVSIHECASTTLGMVTASLNSTFTLYTDIIHTQCIAEVRVVLEVPPKVDEGMYNYSPTTIIWTTDHCSLYLIASVVVFVSPLM